jgi:hypothetical protein
MHLSLYTIGRGQAMIELRRPEIRIAVVRNHASTLSLSRILKQAKLVYAETADDTFDRLRTGHADVMASARRILLDYSTQLPGSRVLEDPYGVNLVGIAVPKGQPGRLAYISEFIEEAKKSWLVQQTIERLGGRELEVAPLEIPVASHRRSDTYQGIDRAPRNRVYLRGVRPSRPRVRVAGWLPQRPPHVGCIRFSRYMAWHPSAALKL